MSQYIIQGGKRLEGELHIDGSKNAVLPIIAATILNGSINYLYNCPRICDVNIMLEILTELGCKVNWEDQTLIIDTSTLHSYDINEALVKKMRSSIILLGAIVGRCGEAKVAPPGGCRLGKRPIDLHLEAFQKMGMTVINDQDCISCKSLHLQGAHIHLELPSVGATENIMLAATLAEGTTTIINPAREPEIIDLQNFLNACGARVSGAGTGRITIEGVKALRGTTYHVIPDRIIAGSYLVAAAITRGHVTLADVEVSHLKAITNKLKIMGCNITEGSKSITLCTPRTLKGIQITTNPYPYFPTDMQSQMMALLCTCETMSCIKENLFEDRFKPAFELMKMGADIHINRQQAKIKPVSNLIGTTVEATDLRGGAALVLAGLAAKGTTIVNETYHIKRGYGNIVEDLRQLGASIQERE